MIKSMTGFGKGEAKGKFGRFTVEVRTVNHRYFDVSLRMPNSLGVLEDKIKKYVHKYIRRGKVNLSLLHKKGEIDLGSAKLNDEAIERCYEMLNKLRKRFKLNDDIRLSHILSFPDVIIQEQTVHDAASMWSTIEPALKKAALDCDRMRKKEGKALYKDFMDRVAKIALAVDKISRLAPMLILEYRNKLHARIKEILKRDDYDIDKSRVELELAIFARQCDVSEEITRAKSHLDAMEETLTSNKEAGRRMDFILQELQREINTLGSKAGAVKISRLIVDIKSEIDKMREQAQNVE